MIKGGNMNNELDKLVFNTKSIMITDKQKEFIETLLDELIDYGDDSFNDIEYWKLSKQDAAKLIKEMKDELDDYAAGRWLSDFDYEEKFYGGDMYTDGFKD